MTLTQEVQINSATKEPRPMTTALDKNGREIRVGDRVRCMDSRVGSVVDFDPACRAGTGVGVDWGEGRATGVWYYADSLELTDPPPLVKDANGNELRVGDKLTALHTHTPYLVAAVEDEGHGLIVVDGDGWNISSNCRTARADRFARVTPPPTAKDAAGGDGGAATGIPEPATHVPDPSREIVAARDTRTAPVDPKLSAGDTVLHSTGTFTREWVADAPAVTTAEQAAELFGYGSGVFNYMQAWEDKNNVRVAPAAPTLSDFTAAIREHLEPRLPGKFKAVTDARGDGGFALWVFDGDGREVHVSSWKVPPSEDGGRKLASEIADRLMHRQSRTPPAEPVAAELSFEERYLRGSR